MSRKVWLKLVGLMVAVLLVVVLIIQNSGSANIKILFFPAAELPQALLLAIIFLLGFVGGIVATFRISSKNKQ